MLHKTKSNTSVCLKIDNNGSENTSFCKHLAKVIILYAFICVLFAVAGIVVISVDPDVKGYVGQVFDGTCPNIWVYLIGALAIATIMGILGVINLCCCKSCFTKILVCIFVVLIFGGFSWSLTSELQLSYFDQKNATLDMCANHYKDNHNLLWIYYLISFWYYVVSAGFIGVLIVAFCVFSICSVCCK
jgi:hypothetical protein